ncbi:unnamed protein product [Enterobius vermicularis]|uniref:Secreted protein n=1 Tax=Enterobius vermicularis TaxID=51028 RepID=A0A0N4VCY5_ENTVE|nr:unnamed protein product [Enterobius vermicularis]
MRLFIFLAILSTAYATEDIFAIRDLITLLTNTTEQAQLRLLMRDQKTPRFQIEAQVQEIVARQPEYVQKLYHALHMERQCQVELRWILHLADLHERGGMRMETIH